MINDQSEQYNQLLEGLANELDIPPSKYQTAVERYTSVGTWLKGGNYPNSAGDPLIYPQGSFRLGTVVRPIKNGLDTDYDIDLVCQLNLNKIDTNPESIKSMAGNRLKENAIYASMLEKENRRCWTLNYAEQDGIGFHMDVLPSTPENQEIIDGLLAQGIPAELAGQAIAISHLEEGVYSWSPSNPNGYAMWFDGVNQPIFLQRLNEAKRQIFEKNRTVFSSIEEVPDQLVKTPLQRAIQILKRHRDIRFAGQENEDAKPISMIITTLAAELYQNEADVYSTLKNIIEQLKAHAMLLKPDFMLTEGYNKIHLITRRLDGTWVIPNPVNPAENFADRWHEDNNRKAQAFFQWVSWVYTDLVQIIENSDFARTKKLLGARFGEQLIEKAAVGLIGILPATSPILPDSTPKIVINNPSKPWGCQW